MMKKKTGRLLAALLAFCLLAVSLVGCAAKGKTLLKLEDMTMSVNLYQLFLSRMKGTLSSAYYFGEEALTEDFWDTRMPEGKTYDEYYCEQVLNSAKTYLAAMYAFELEELELPDSYVEEINSEMQNLMDYDAEGSKSVFNSILAPFGVNHTMLREAYIIEAKIDYLMDHLFGADGSKISALLLDEYYQANYARFKHIVYYNFEYVYETDDNGDNIYYKGDSKRIAYDTEADTKLDESGKTVTDANGDYIRYTEDGKIAYDKKNGELREVYSNGAPLTRKLTTEELIQMEDIITLTMEKAAEGNYSLFDAMVQEYSEDTDGIAEYPGGYYLTESDNSNIPKKLTETVMEMKPGEIRRVDTEEYGTSIVMRYELEEDGYTMEKNADFFIDNRTGTFTFMETLKNQLFAEYLAPYIEKIEVDEALLKSVSMKTVGANSYY